MSKKIKLSEVLADDSNLPPSYYDLLQKYLGTFGQQLGIKKFNDFVEEESDQNQKTGEGSSQPPPASEGGSTKGYSRLGDFCRGGDSVLCWKLGQ